MSQEQAKRKNVWETVGPDTPAPAEEGRGAPKIIETLRQSVEEQGFLNRAVPEVAVKRQRKTEGTIHQFTMRCRVRDSNKFVMWCDENRLPYREGFEKLVAMIDKIDLSKKGGAS